MSDEEHHDEPADPSGEERDLEEGVQLTPEQQEALRRSMEVLARSVTPKIKFPIIPEATLRNLAAVSGIAEARQAMVASAIKPVLEAQLASQKNFRVINSDILKSLALAQSNLNLIASQLTKNIDYGIADSVAKLAAQFAQQQTSWLKSLGPAIASMRATFYPANLREIEGLKLVEVEQVVMVDGIPLYGVPREIYFRGAPSGRRGA